MNNVSVFQSVEFGSVRTIMVDGEAWFVGVDVAKALGYVRPSEAVTDHCKGTAKHRIGVTTGTKVDGTQANQIVEMNIIPERDVYRLIMRSKLPTAEKFEEWVVGEVLPSIRKNGMYATPITIENMIANPDFAIELLVKLKEEQANKKKLEVKVVKLEQEVTYKEDVIIGLVKDITLAEKRQRINQIMRHNFKDGTSMQDRWRLLYSEFERKYHCNIKKRMESCDVKPKIKNKVDYIDKVMSMTPELYELACKIFENDIQTLKEEWFSVLQD